jgi:hypothetical protein
MERIHILKVFLILLLIHAGSTIYGQYEPIKVIVDTDLDSDIDDAAALAALHHFANEGKVEILATISSSALPGTVELINIINRYYNRPDIPVAKPEQGAPAKEWIVKHEQVASEFSHDITMNNAPTSNHVYRQILSQQENNSVVIISLGYLNNLSELLQSGPDQYSDLTGTELVQKKVRTYFCMGGRYPADVADTKSKVGNFRPDPVAAIYVEENWPTQLIYTGGGGFAKKVKCGNSLKETPENNPVRRTYELGKSWKSDNWEHPTADIITIYVAVEGIDHYFNEVKYGYNYIDRYGRNRWVVDKEKPLRSCVSEFKPGVDIDEIKKVFEFIISQKPLKQLSIQ